MGEDVKDEGLRKSIMIVAKSYLSRNDLAGKTVHDLLMNILDGAEVMDKVIDTKPRKRK